MGDIYEKQWNFTAALEVYERGLDILEMQEEKNCSAAIVYERIGDVYYRQADYSLALDYFWKALALYQKIKEKDEFETGRIMNKIGSVYGKIKEQDVYIGKIIGAIFDAMLQP